MNGWLDDYPGRSRDYELEVAVEVQAELADDLEGDELRVARHLLGEWATEPGGLAAKLRQVEGMTGPEERREVAAQAYHALGLEPPEERREREELESRPVPHRPLLECVICGTPPRDANGFPTPMVTPARRWHCPDHVHLAQPGDLDPPPAPITAGMQLLPDPAEVERERQRDARLKQAQDERDKERAARGREIAAAREIHERRLAEGLAGGPR